MRCVHIGSFAVAGRARPLKFNGYRSSPLIRKQIKGCRCPIKIGERPDRNRGMDTGSNPQRGI